MFADGMTSDRAAHAGELAARARAVMPGGVNSGQRAAPGLEDLVVARAAGGRFWDVDGSEFLDCHLAFGPIILGHADPQVDAAAAAAVRRADLVGVGRTVDEIELAELLVEVVPSMEQVLLTSSGSEATFHALRLARAATGRGKILKFQGCFHGWHDAVAMNVASRADRIGSRDPMSLGMMEETVSSTVVARFNDLADTASLLAEHAGEVAAIIVEPIPHSIGAVLPADGFLAGLRALCDESGAILIFDEVVTGFRHALGGYQEVCGVRPDVTVVGKSMANGYPIAAVGGRADLMSEFSTRPGGGVLFQGTYNGHAGAVGAAVATIRRLRDEPVHEHLFRLGSAVRGGLREAVDDLGLRAVVTGYGSLFITYFLEPPVLSYEDCLRNDADIFVSYRRELIGRGVFEFPLNLKRSCFCYAHELADAERVVEQTHAALARVAHLSA